MTCNASFEATEVDTPASFIILPVETVVDTKNGDGGDWDGGMEYTQEGLNKASSCVTTPLDFALFLDSIEEQFIEKTMLLYLL
jgi:hypothetical protein